LKKTAGLEGGFCRTFFKAAEGKEIAAGDYQ
jgi:hypothetical protein